MTSVTVEHNRNLWLEQRRMGIGSSDTASLFSEASKYGCTRRLVFDKRGVPIDFERPEPDQAVFERGHVLEPIIAKKFSERYGLKMRRKAMIMDRSRPDR